MPHYAAQSGVMKGAHLILRSRALARGVSKDGRTPCRHPEVLASSASLEGWMQQRCLRHILRGSQELAPQDDGL
jgi:hypothetical protein